MDNLIYLAAVVLSLLFLAGCLGAGTILWLGHRDQRRMQDRHNQLAARIRRGCRRAEDRLL